MWNIKVKQNEVILNDNMFFYYKKIKVNFISLLTQQIKVWRQKNGINEIFLCWNIFCCKIVLNIVVLYKNTIN